VQRIERPRRLGARSRRTLRALAEVIVPRDPSLPVDLDAVVDFVDQTVGDMPRLLQLVFPIGLALFELGTFVLLPSLRRFSRLELPRREAYVRDWIHSRLMLRRDLIKGVKGLCLFAYYNDRRVMEHLGYRPDEHLQLVAAERLKRHGHEL
jgi:hypothetical protein